MEIFALEPLYIITLLFVGICTGIISGLFGIGGGAIIVPTMILLGNDIKIAVGISIADAKACEVQFDMAADNDIPIVAFDSGSDYQGVMATVSTDNEAAAREAAVKLAEAVGDEGEVVLFVQDSKSMAALARERAFTEEIQTNHPNMSVVSVYHMDQLGEMQQTIAAEINAGTYQLEADTTENTAAQEEVSPEEITEKEIVDFAR